MTSSFNVPDMFCRPPCDAGDAALHVQSGVGGSRLMRENHSSNCGAGERGQMWTGRGVRRRHRYDDRVPHRPGVLQNRDELCDRRWRLVTRDQPCPVVIVSTHITYHLAKERTQTMASAIASERRDRRSQAWRNPDCARTPRPPRHRWNLECARARWGAEDVPSI